MAIAPLCDDEELARALLGTGRGTPAAPHLRLVAPGRAVTRVVAPGKCRPSPLAAGAPARAVHTRPAVPRYCAHRPSPAVRRRRLVVVAVAVIALLLAGAALLGVPSGAPTSSGSAMGSLTAAAAPTSAALPIQTRAGSGTFYVVRPGDTLASIARRLDPTDPAGAARLLARRLGSPVVVPGEHVPVP